MISRGGHAPLAGRRIVVPRTVDRRSELAARLRQLGGEVLEVRVAQLRRRDDQRLAEAVEDLRTGRFRSLVAASGPAVGALVEELDGADLEADVRARMTVVALGRGAAAALRRLGIVAELISADPFVGAGPPRPTLLLTAAEPVDVPSDVETVITHDLVPLEQLPSGVVRALDAGEVDAVAVASSASVLHLAELVGEAATSVVTIGPRTTRACEEVGWDVAAEASSHDLDGLVETVLDVLRGEAGEV